MDFLLKVLDVVGWCRTNSLITSLMDHGLLKPGPEFLVLIEYVFSDLDFPPFTSISFHKGAFLGVFVSVWQLYSGFAYSREVNISVASNK